MFPRARRSNHVRCVRVRHVGALFFEIKNPRVPDGVPIGDEGCSESENVPFEDDVPLGDEGCSESDPVSRCCRWSSMRFEPRGENMIDTAQGRWSSMRFGPRDEDMIGGDTRRVSSNLTRIPRKNPRNYNNIDETSKIRTRLKKTIYST